MNADGSESERRMLSSSGRVHGKSELLELVGQKSFKDIIEMCVVKRRIKSKCKEKSAPIPQEARSTT